MELDPKDYDVVRLLTKLKDNNGAYPPELMTPRRQTYLRRVTEIGLGFGVSSALKTTVKSGSKAGSYSTIAGGLLEAALVVAIVAEAGAAAYAYRDQISALVQSYTSQPRVEEVTSLPATEFSPILPGLILSDPTKVTTTPLVEVTPSGAPIPGAVASAASSAVSSAGANNNNQNSPGIQSNSTSDPNGNNGNQYGLTPKPDPTKEPGGNNNNGNQYGLTPKPDRTKEPGGNNNNDNNNDKGKGKDK